MDLSLVKTTIINFNQLHKFQGTRVSFQVRNFYAKRFLTFANFLPFRQAQIGENLQKFIEWKVEKVNCQSIFTHQYSAPRCRVFGEVIICNWDKQRQTT